MTPRQSNMVFYSVIALIICGLAVNALYPDFFEDLSKSKEELAIKEAVSQGEHAKALPIYQQLIDKKISNNNVNTVETAELYESMASSYAQLGNKVEAKNNYLAALDIKLKIEKVNPYSVASTYFTLGEIAEDEKQYDQAQSYYESALAKQLGDTKRKDKEGVFEGLQNAQIEYKRLNNPYTIASLKKLGALHAMKQESAMAKDYYERALAASKTTFGDDDAKTLEVIKLIKQLKL
ncbi:tetratricopeptide repeat protein [Leucothrix sargassi]|nr:tetratricopeptide repeat protein [Leucothrix sargassi]